MIAHVAMWSMRVSGGNLIGYSAWLSCLFLCGFVQNVKYLRAKLLEMGAPQKVLDAFEEGWIISELDGVEKLSRSSEYTRDYLVVNWLCENGFNGYLATHVSRFHDEIMICDPSKNLKYMLKHTTNDLNIPICEKPYNELEIVMVYAPN